MSRGNVLPRQVALMEGNIEQSLHKCPLCVFVAVTIPLVLSHLRLVHSSDPNFSVNCGIEGCCTTSRSFSALYQHIRKKHRDVGIIKNRGTTTLNSEVDSDTSSSFPSSRSDSVVDDHGKIYYIAFPTTFLFMTH